MINDSFGFDAGEEVIMGVGDRLAKTLRGTDVIGRTAGNKFGVILKNCSEKEIAVVASRLRAAVRGHRRGNPLRHGRGHRQRGRGVAAPGRRHQPGSHAARRTGAEPGARQWPRRLCRLPAFGQPRDRAPAPHGDRRRGDAGAAATTASCWPSSPSCRPSPQGLALRMPAAHGGRRRQDPHRRPFRARPASRWASCIWSTVSRWKPRSRS